MMRKITSILPFSGERIIFDSGTWTTYTRYAPTHWTVTMGESDEEVYDQEEINELESLYQARICNRRYK